MNHIATDHCRWSVIIHWQSELKADDCDINAEKKKTVPPCIMVENSASMHDG